jgi:hypothetical protein
LTDQLLDILVHNFVHLVRTAPLLLGAATEARLRTIIAAMAAEAARQSAAAPPAPATTLPGVTFSR